MTEPERELLLWCAEMLMARFDVRRDSNAATGRSPAGIDALIKLVRSEGHK